MRAVSLKTFGRALLCVAGLGLTVAFGANLDPSLVTVEQLNFRNAPNGRVGTLTVSLGTLAPGYVNAWDSTGANWLVRNMPVPDATVVDATSVTSRFDLGVPDGTPVSSKALIVDYAASPNTTGTVPAGDTAYTFPVTQAIFAVGSVDTNDVQGYMPPPDFSGFSPTMAPLGPVLPSVEQNDHPNLQAAKNQCAPAAVANGLTWLQNANCGAFTLPDINIPGVNGQAGLVGRLDLLMGRVVNGVSRTQGQGVWPFDGKLAYLAATNLTNITVKYQGGGFTGGAGASNVLQSGAPMNLPPRYGITAQGAGANPTLDFIYNELKNGESVEMCIRYNKTGTPQLHYVQVVAAGFTPTPFLKHFSDKAQTDQDPNDALGTTQPDFEHVSTGVYPFSTTDVPIYGGALLTGSTLFLRESNAYVVQVITQSVAHTIQGDTTKPCCTNPPVIIPGPPKQLQMTVQDGGSGLGSVVVTQSLNATTVVPPFGLGTTTPLVVVATKIDQSQSSQVQMTITDEAGNVTVCDPEFLHLEVPQTPGRGRAIAQVTRKIRGSYQVARSESQLLIQNDKNVGLSVISITINGKFFGAVQLVDGEYKAINLSAGLTQEENTIVLVGDGRPGSSADIVIYGGN